MSKDKSVSKDTRYKNYEVITYPDSVDRQAMSAIIDNAEHWCRSPLHDKDLKKDGSPVKPHWHNYIILRNGKTISAMRKACNVSNSQVELIHDSPQACYIYACHAAQDDKIKYDENERLCDDVDFWEKSTVAKNNDRYYEMCVDVVKMPPYEFVKKYGRDGMVFFRTAREIAAEQRRWIQGKAAVDKIKQAEEYSKTRHLMDLPVNTDTPFDK